MFLYQWVSLCRALLNVSYPKYSIQKVSTTGATDKTLSKALSEHNAVIPQFTSSMCTFNTTHEVKTDIAKINSPLLPMIQILTFWHQSFKFTF
jgi:hypothetical protein